MDIGKNELPNGDTNYDQDDVELLLKRADASIVCVFDVSPVYAGFRTALKAQIAAMGEDDEHKEVVEAAIITRMMAHVLEFQRNNDIYYMERCANMALNILREYELPQVEFVCSTWLPILLYGTGLFIKKKYGDISRIWELKAAIDGVLYISPAIEEQNNEGTTA